MAMISNNDLVLFQGDSVTDTGRDREKDNLGTGYAFIASSLYSARYPERNIRFLNRGISGNRVPDLQARWEEDCLNLKPNVLSILIGINDCWRRFDRNDPTSVTDFYNGYVRLLTRVQENLPDTKIILMEPFLVPAREEQKSWREDLDPKIQAVRDLSREFNTRLVPLDGLFAAACSRREPTYWAHDGVHPTPAGHGLIARAWLDVVTK